MNIKEITVVTRSPNGAHRVVYDEQGKVIAGSEDNITSSKATHITIVVRETNGATHRCTQNNLSPEISEAIDSLPNVKNLLSNLDEIRDTTPTGADKVKLEELDEI